MAKNKKKAKPQKRQPLSPRRFMQEKVRKLPIGKCYYIPGWEEAGITPVVVTRERPDGHYVAGIFLVDTFCIGVKDATYRTNIDKYELEDILNRYDGKMQELTYDEAHNLVYGAIAFAEEGGIEPVKEFDVAKYILEEDTDDIPLIEYEFGKDGKHFLIVNKDRREMPYYRQLKKTLGDDFEYVLEVGEPKEFVNNLTMEDIERGLAGMKKMMDETNRHPGEVYSYQRPEYPEELSVKNQFIADAFYSPDNMSSLPEGMIERILALPHDEAAEDISRIVMFEIGRTYQAINDETIEEGNNSAMLHSIYLLTQLRSEKGLDAILEIMRQNEDFADYHMGDLAPEILPAALYACGANNIPAIEAYLYQPGLSSYLRGNAVDALAMVVFNHPERRAEIIEVFRKLLRSMVTRLPEQEACDGAFAGMMMCTLMDLEAKELVEEIKAVFDTDCVDRGAAGDCKKVIGEITKGCKYINRDNYKFPDIYEQYRRLQSFMHD